MGTITRRASGRYQVKIRRNGASFSRSFSSHDSAKRWERACEAELDLGIDRSSLIDLRRTTLATLVERWITEVLPHRTSAGYEGPEAQRLLAHPIAAKNLAYIGQSDFRRVLAELQALPGRGGDAISPDTVIRKWTVYRTILRCIRDEWGYAHWANPLLGIRLPAPREHRERRWEPHELKRLVAAWRESRRQLIVTDDGCITWVPFENPKARGGCRNRYVPLIARLALETSIRRSELLSIRVDNIDLVGRRLRLAESATKNRTGRWVPLTAVAANLIRRALRQPGRAPDEPLLFPISRNAFKCCWRAIMARARLTEDGVRFHDMRREAISRGIDAGLTLPQIVGLSGHKDLRAARRYFAPDLRTVSDTLDAGRLRNSALPPRNKPNSSFKKGPGLGGFSKLEK